MSRPTCSTRSRSSTTACGNCARSEGRAISYIAARPRTLYAGPIRISCIVIAVAASACGRIGFRDRAGADADVHDAALAPDAPRVLLETLVVPSDGTQVTSATVLVQGDPYVLVASGTFVAVP